MDCPNCGIGNKQDAAFCMSCGAPLPGAPFAQLKKEETSRPQAPAAPPPQAPAAEPVTRAMEPPPAAPPPAAPAPPPKPVYYIPPESDYVRAKPRAEPVPAARAATTDEAPPAAPPSQDSTQTIAPVVAAETAAVRERKAVCPECYAPNPEGNGYCQECGSALPVTTGRPAAATRPAAAPPAPRKTAVLPTAAPEGAAAQPAYHGETTLARPARGDKAFGVADILALLAVGAGAIAISFSYVLDSFTWKKGLDIAMFSHQGAYTPGRTDLLGGPGILPYEGAEFFTVGLVAALALALALVFLVVRTGRGPMFILSGSLLLLPAAYMLFQALLPLRQMGISVDPALGLSGMFFGNEANAGAGLSFWMITAAGALLLVAGFIAPPRGWGRLFTFALCFGAVLGISFFCAASFNWNLFISQAAAISGAGGITPAALALPPPALF